MKIAVIALTKNAMELAATISDSLGADVFDKSDFKATVKRLFYSYDALIFIMACGIVVRTIAPFIQDKQTDPAVVVVDEQGQFSISLLSGHIGGANRLASKVAGIIGATPVISTATDLNNTIAFDELAKDNNCAIENIADLKYISSRLVDGGDICIYSDLSIKGNLPDNIKTYNERMDCDLLVAITNSTKPFLNSTKPFLNSTKPLLNSTKILYLRPRNLVLGIGCKKGKTLNEIETAVLDFLFKNSKSILSVKCIASISIKAEEEGIIQLSQKCKIPFKTFTAEQIKEVEHEFVASDFVKSITGVGSVAEACATLAADLSDRGNKLNRGTKLICEKTVYGGITLAMTEEEMVITL